MTRLTNDIRNSIVMDLLRHRFKDRIEALYADRAALAQAIYEEAFSAEHRKKMAALPEGWLAEVSSINARLGAEYCSYDFSGSLYGDINTIVSNTKKEVRRFPYSRRNDCVVSFDATHKLAAESDRVNSERKSLSDDIEKAKRAAEAAVNAVSTVKRLVEVWPEVAPFAAEYNTEKPQLPAVQTAQLNTMLGLPVEEKEAA